LEISIKEKGATQEENIFNLHKEVFAAIKVETYCVDSVSYVDICV